MNIGSELPTQLHKATLAEVDQKIHQSVHLPLTIYLALKFTLKPEMKQIYYYSFITYNANH